jgi:large subunit ribosomal protein L5e
MDKFYPGNSKVDGTVYDVSEKPNEERRPFMAFLDVGLTRTTVGNRVFGALKGACDGGLYVPHSERRFPGFSSSGEDKEKYDAKVHRDRIFGVHVDKWFAK